MHNHGVQAYFVFTCAHTFGRGREESIRIVESKKREVPFVIVTHSSGPDPVDAIKDLSGAQDTRTEKYPGSGPASEMLSHYLLL